MTTEMTTMMMPAMMIGMRGGISVRRYKRKVKFGECGVREN